MEDLYERLVNHKIEGMTHSGKFHADDVFSTALLQYFYPEMRVTRVSQVPEDFDGIVYDIGRGRYDHHQKDARVRENGVSYAAFGLLWEQLGPHILGQELAELFDTEFVQPLDLNDNTGEKNELANLIGDFNPVWDSDEDSNIGFFRAVNVAKEILQNKFHRYQGNERAEQKVQDILTRQKQEHGDEKILVLDEFVPCQKQLSETEIAFLIFPSNRGGYCIQPVKKADSNQYKCGFPKHWLGLEGELLQTVTGTESAKFCHKTGFIMTTELLEDAITCCKKSLEEYVAEPFVYVMVEDAILNGVSLEELTQMIRGKEGMEQAKVLEYPFPDYPDFIKESRNPDPEERNEWKNTCKDVAYLVSKSNPEYIIIGGNSFITYPIIRALRKKKVPVYGIQTGNGLQILPLV